VHPGTTTGKTGVTVKLDELDPASFAITTDIVKGEKEPGDVPKKLPVEGSKLSQLGFGVWGDMVIV
jgi:hypothetical protein